MSNKLKDPDHVCLLIRVNGMVQNVGFRFFTYRVAQKLNLVGYVKNLANGAVEIVACGNQIQVDNLVKWLQAGGPCSAHIASYDVHNISANEPFTDFSVRY